ncbi:MAG: hypothetical protein WCP22_09525, partial [Chlamydiota bacterium]
PPTSTPTVTPVPPTSTPTRTPTRTPTVTPTPGEPLLKINFQPRGYLTPEGFYEDEGRRFDYFLGYGWLFVY